MKRVYTFFVMVISLSCWLNIAKAQTVRVPDANLAAVVRHTLSLAPNARITRQAMQRLTRLNAQPHYVRQITGQSGTIHNLTGLEHATGLTDLVLSGNQISNIRPLARLTNLEDLDLWSNQISDLKPLVGLTQLEYLDLSSNQISDLKPLVGLTQLNALVLGHNQIRDVTPLAGLTNLEELYLQGNPIQDASPLANLPNLTDTDIDIPEPPPIRIPDPNLAAAVRKALGLDPKAPIITQRAMLRLTILDARESQIANLSGLEYATQLTELYLYKNQIRSIVPLPSLTHLKRLDLEENQIRDIRPLTGLKQLEELYLSGNQIKNKGVPLLANLTELRMLSLNANQISNIKPLTSLTKLERLWLEDNKIRDVSPLAGLVNLEVLKLIGNPVKDLSPLVSLTKLSDVDVEIPRIAMPNAMDPAANTAGPKIQGPWLWVIAPTNGKLAPEAASSGKDYLEAASGGSVTEQEIAENGAAAGAQVGKKAWTYGNLAPTGYNNITEMVNAIGLGKGYIIDHHVAYGSITLDSPRKQNTQMWVGSDDSVKVWLNGVLVHNNPADRGTNEYNENLPATLKKGKNILLVAVYNGLGAWSGFFGFKKDTIYSPVITSLVHINSAERPPIYWIDTEAGTLHRLIGDAVEDLLPDVQNATSLTIDPTDNKIYWTEQTGKNMGSIKHANLDGSNLQILATLQGTATSFAVDVANNTLYWTTSSEKIRWANLNGEQTQDLIHKLEAPSNIILDAAAGKLYWTEAPGRIQRANLNGKKVENIASGLEAVGDLSILGNKIYWTEKTGENTGKIGRTNLNGSGFTTLIKLQQAPTGLAIDAVGRKLYWSDSGGNIKRSNLNGKKIQNVVSSLGAPINIVLGSAPAAPAAAPTQVAEIPDQTVLLANYPNPFNPETWIPYQLAKPSDVKITIYNTRGLVVRQLALGHQPAGTYTSQSRAAYWDGRNSQGERVASGIYFYQFQADNVSSLRKMLILK